MDSQLLIFRDPCVRKNFDKLFPSYCLGIWVHLVVPFVASTFRNLLDIALCVASRALSLSTPLLGIKARPSSPEGGARFHIRFTLFSMCSQRYSPPEPAFSFSAAKPHKVKPKFYIDKLVWERKDAMAAQKRAEEAQARSKHKKVVDPRAMMISSYKAPNDDSIFADLSPIVEDLTISDHEK
ncbi:hypothetical protein H5410_036271 [Solanum commersonii]|uniref:Uncharacterized protein n=1 Tax=Solanum commersonii TaxID=4109 RepID=A0A9J5Y561_SOLCO|nr:hypothetical protein H5410_036271 [Solanum commersonii]